MNKKLLHKILFVFIVLCFTSIQHYAHANNNLSLEQIIQQKRITANIKNVPIKSILLEIQKQTGISFVFKNDTDFSALNSISINVKNVSVEEALKTLFDNTDFTYNIIGETITIVKKPAAKTQTKDVTVSGKVIDKSTKKAIPGATIIIKETSKGAITDDNGNFTLSASVGSIIEVSFMGMKTQEITIKEANGNMTISLENDAMAVEDVVVNGYFAKAKTSYTGAAKSFGKEEMRKVSNQNVMSTLSLLDPSFKMVENNLMGSDPNTVPEFTIRGGSDFNSTIDGTKGTRNLPLFVLDGFIVSAQQIYDLDPNRVENITTLKDAAATAIYGSRAGNGVVIIETVRLQKGKIRLTYTGDVNFELPDITCYNVLNSEEKLEYEKIAGIYDLTGMPWFDESRRHLYNERKKLVEQKYNTDWLNKPIKSVAIGHKHSALVEGGDDSFVYGMMLNYEDKVGVMKKSNRERLGINVKLQYRYKGFRLKNELGFQRVTANGSPFGNFSTYVMMNPYYPYLNNDGTYKKVLDYERDVFGEKGDAIVNPLYNGNLKHIDKDIADRLINNFQIEWDITKDFKLKGQFSVAKDWGQIDIYKSDKHTDFENYTGDDLFRKGEYQKTNSSGLNYSGNVIASFNKTMGDHFVSVNAGFDISQDATEYLSFVVEGVTDIAANPSLALQYSPGSIPKGDDSKTRSIGVLGNASYTLKGKYFVDASYRTDASSIYGKNSRWGGFWSVGIGWNIHNEKFLSNSKNINYLKLRSSVGTTGGQNFYAYQAMKTYRFINSRRYENWQGVDIVGIDNPNLKWQRNTKVNIGADFEFFGSKLKGTLDYYWETSKDNMTDVSIPSSLGFSQYKDNLGSVRNTGIELGLNYKYLDKKDFRSNLFVNVYSNRNKIIKISEDLVAFNKQQDAAVDNKPRVRYIEGESINTIWAVPSLGINPESGDELFLNRFGKATSKWDALDYLPMGCSDPKIEGTFGNMFSYKGLQLNIVLSYRLGAELYNSTLVDKIENSDPNRNVDRRAFDQGWKKPGDISFYKRPGSTKTEPTSRFIEKERYLKLSSINVGYYLPQDVCKAVKMESVKITVFMNDIFTWSSIKQERGISYPYARNISASLQVTF